jgi:hypothetical protein
VTEPNDPFDPAPAPGAPLWQRWLRQPLVMLVLAVVSLAAGIWMSRNTSREAAERADLPPRADCVRFPGACAEGVPTEPPAELAALATEVTAAERDWNATLERERRSGVFPEKGLTDMRKALATTDAAVRDAHALLQEADASGNSTARVLALEALRDALDAKRSLLQRATRLLEQAV